jgi:hypothetical protein
MAAEPRSESSRVSINITMIIQNERDLDRCGRPGGGERGNKSRRSLSRASWKQVDDFAWSE